MPEDEEAGNGTVPVQLGFRLVLGSDERDLKSSGLSDRIQPKGELLPSSSNLNSRPIPFLSRANPNRNPQPRHCTSYQKRSGEGDGLTLARAFPDTAPNPTPSPSLSPA
eukprot:1320285-Amorphochlora_amoeboformis.AAC.1